MEFTLHDGLNEQELNNLIRQADIANSQARANIARNDKIKAMAQHRLISMQIDAAECE